MKSYIQKSTLQCIFFTYGIQKPSAAKGILTAADASAVNDHRGCRPKDPDYGVGEPTIDCDELA